MNASADISYNKMKVGEYEVHVLIEATSGVSLDKDSDVDVMLSVNAFGKTQYSKVKSDVGYEETFWGEHFFFNEIFTNETIIEGQRLVLSVWDYNKILKNSLVGTYQLDIKRIYSQQTHSLNHIWLALSNPQRQFKDITGYIKTSISVIGQGDKNIQLSVQPIASITKQKKVLMPPSISRKSYQLIVDIYKGEQIKPADGQTVDSYIGVEFGQIFEKTQPVMKNCNPTFNTRVYVPLALPAVTENIAFRINDFNFIAKVQVIGSHYMNISKLIAESNAGKKQEPKWINFYGPQKDTDYEQHKNVYQFFPTIAPFYVGSILMKVSIAEQENPSRKRQQITEQIPNKLVPVFYRISGLITAGLNLANRNKKYSVRIRVGVDQVRTQQIKCQNGFCLWQSRLIVSTKCYQNQLCPDVFVYLVDHKGINVCFLRYPAKLGLVLEDQWVNLKPDLSVVELQNEEAGYLKVELKMEKTKEKERPSATKFNSQLARIAQSKGKKGKIVIELISAESLIPLDEDGSADPYFTFTYMHSEITSTKKQDTLNPIFFQKLVIEAPVTAQEGCPPIIINAYDQDKLSRDFIGTAFVDLGEAEKNGSLVYGSSKRPNPIWMNLTQNNVISGKFLAGFIILENSNANIPKQIDIPSKKFSINLFILGLRSMKTNGLLSVKKPYVQFDYQNMNVYGNLKAESKSKNVVTEPKEEGSSINIKTINQTSIYLPQNPSYWPSLSGRVKDYILGGIYEPVLGYFAINLRLCHQRSKKIKEELLRQRKITYKKKPIVNGRNPRLKAEHQKVLLPLRNFIIKCLNYKWPILTPKTDLNKIHNTNKKINEKTVVVLPNYEQHDAGNYRQIHKDLIRQNKEYIKIGYDKKQNRGKNKEKRNKHYRFFLDEPYEEYYQRVNGIKMGIYDQIEIRKGRVFPSNDVASNLIRKVTAEDAMAGIYKGNCYVQDYKSSLSQDDKLFRKKAQQNLKNFMNNSKVYMFLYIIEAAEIPPKDTFSLSDPYLVIKLGGDEEINLKDKYFQDDLNPQFMQKIKRLLSFPVNSTIEIQVWDYDPIKNDQFIGSAIVNIENRVFSQFGSVSGNNPIQTHRLKAKQSRMSQGLIRFWIDLVPADQIALYREIDIGAKEDSDFELRVIVWGCSGMPNDDIEDMNDLFVRCTFNGEDQETDTHFRTTTGIGTFNWRMVYKMKLPQKDPTLTFRVYDKDLITFDDYISSGSFSLLDYLQQAFETQAGVKLYLGQKDLSQFSANPYSAFKVIQGKKMYDRFEVELVNKVDSEELNIFGQKQKKIGKVQISIQILPRKLADKNPAGKGRSQPNQHPHLDQPKDRFQWSWNPLILISRLCGPAFRYKVLCVFIILVVIFLFYNFGHSFLGSVVANFIN